MSNNNSENRKNKGKEDLHKKNIKHEPQAESARAVFGKEENNKEQKKDIDWITIP